MVGTGRYVYSCFAPPFPYCLHPTGGWWGWGWHHLRLVEWLHITISPLCHDFLEMKGNTLAVTTLPADSGGSHPALWLWMHPASRIEPWLGAPLRSGVFQPFTYCLSWWPSLVHQQACIFPKFPFPSSILTASFMSHFCRMIQWFAEMSWYPESFGALKQEGFCGYKDIT